MSIALDLAGVRFGRLIAKERAESKNGKARWFCVCDCGQTTVVTTDSLRHGYTKSCGCLYKDSRKTCHTQTVHGGSYTRLYSVWQGMKYRCYNENHKQYKNYGGRGISMCDEWKNDFAEFQGWAIENGYDENASKGRCTIDRIDNDGNYSPSNCRFITALEQCKNRRTNHWVVANGEKMIVKDCARKYNIPRTTIANRDKRGCDVLTGLPKQCDTA